MSESQRTNHTESSNTGAVIEDNNRPCYHQLDAIFREKENINSMFEFNHSDPHAKISDNGVGAMVGNKSISLENEDNEANMQSLDWLNQHHYCVWMKQMKKLIKNQIQLLQALNSSVRGFGSPNAMLFSNTTAPKVLLAGAFASSTKSRFELIQSQIQMEEQRATQEDKQAAREEALARLRLDQEESQAEQHEAQDESQWSKQLEWERECYQQKEDQIKLNEDKEAILRDEKKKNGSPSTRKNGSRGGFTNASCI
ncbi:hypothetical protein VP01_2527g2 [Puccinia sorghi]|uniref:No apical meristem-associated C-terminal domain-containing protein n=1 Tax=Puccinia sorghi TaxID=27349 RepID=A0A0L6V5J0_9BASI|nr:hypothetical protein VP01_2527g2 [Puccinia sorghi]